MAVLIGTVERCADDSEIVGNPANRVSTTDSLGDKHRLDWFAQTLDTRRSDALVAQKQACVHFPSSWQPTVGGSKRCDGALRRTSVRCRQREIAFRQRCGHPRLDRAAVPLSRNESPGRAFRNCGHFGRLR